MKVRAGLVALALLLVSCSTASAQEPVPATTTGIWISQAEIEALPTSGPAWDALVEVALEPIENPDLSDQDDRDNVRVLAKALYSARTGDRTFAFEVLRALDAVRGTESGATALAVGRELMAYVIAAEIVGLRPQKREDFEAWLRGVRDRSFQGRTIASTHEDRPNNWGTHAGATRLAVAAYLGDVAEIERAAHVFRGWAGEEDGWQGFEFGDPSWQAFGAAREYAVNPVGARRDRYSIGGVLPDDQRRAGPFAWPPPKENYVYEALQGAVAQAAILERLGYDSWSWGDRAIERAMRWLYVQALFPPEGDDTWIPYVVNRAYGTSFSAPLPSKPGKGIGFTDWTHTTPQ